MKRLGALVFILLVAFMFLQFSTPLSANPIPPEPANLYSLATSVTFAPNADAYVDQSHPTSNYGLSTQLRVDNSPMLRSFLRFTVQGLATKVTKATLRLYANTSLSTGYVVHSVSSNNWSESTINWNNAPAIGSSVSSSGPVTAGTWTSTDVTAIVTGNGTFTLALKTSSATALSLASRHTSYAPQLIIQTSTPTSTPTATQPAKTATPAATATVFLPTVTRTPTSTPPSTSGIPSIGVNHSELFAEYSGQDAYTNQKSQARAGAIKALKDAASYGFNYMRIRASGFCPSDFAMWQNPSTRANWWSLFDQMVAEAQADGVRLVVDIGWNKYSFPDAAGEPLSALFDFTTPSKSNALLKQFTYEIVTRYRSSPTILFWEIGNEYNLGVDKDLNAVANDDPCNANIAGNKDYTTAQLAAFKDDLAKYIKGLDPDHLVSSGDSRPRPSAYHLSQCPVWQAGCVQYPPHDTYAQQVQWLQMANPKSIDLMSVHLYPDSNNPWTIADYQSMATAISRTLYVGEFGDEDANGNWVYPSTFVQNILNNIVSARTPYSTAWRWEGYRSFVPVTPYTLNIDPAVNPDVVNMIVNANNQLKR